MHYRVILHEGVVPEALHPQLESGIRRAYAEVFGGDGSGLAVGFEVLPRGHFFTAAKPSRSSIVAGPVPAGTSREDRTRLLAGITNLWCDVTGCDSDHIVVSASDVPA